MRLGKSILLLVIPLLIIACGDSQRIDEEKFVDFYKDMSLAADTIGFDIESLKSIRINLHKKYNTNEIMFENTLKYFNEDPKRWDAFFTKVMDRLESERKLLNSTP
jgi:hypothetical protein